MATLGADQVQLVVRVLDATDNMHHKKNIGSTYVATEQLAHELVKIKPLAS
ncbi:hypothetical protein D3C76_909820 [compost metagenome]|nr:hypothetical protein EC849_101661 [Pseudomonas putida]